MSVLVRTGGRLTVMSKGAPDTLLKRCTRVRRAGRVEPLSARGAPSHRQAVDDMAKQALRVLALAYAELPEAAAAARRTLRLPGRRGNETWSSSAWWA